LPKSYYFSAKFSFVNYFIIIKQQDFNKSKEKWPNRKCVFEKNDIQFSGNEFGLISAIT